ncbi:ABC transporter permease subunit [Streptomyces ziwulingensis]|uniref:ABC transporter permease subunit n=1 Tax=Streptomyces ziwulingensis TaxID=1045501 RepID=A0ABP9BTK4_9ACTN
MTARAWAVVTAEFTKIRTVRSTLWTFVLTFLVSAGIGLALGLAVAHSFDGRTAEERASFDPVYTGFQGMVISQIVLLVFGVLVVASEYSSGTIQPSLTATPRRGLFYAGKIAVGTLLAAAVALLTSFVTFFAAQAALGAHGAGWGDPEVARAVWGTAFYMTAMCAFAMGVTAMLRSSALSLSVLIPLFFIVSPILNAVPKVKSVARFLPDRAGIVLMRVVDRDDMAAYSVSTAVAVLAVWTVLALAGGYAVLRVRDA